MVEAVAAGLLSLKQLEDASLSLTSGSCMCMQIADPEMSMHGMVCLQQGAGMCRKNMHACTASDALKGSVGLGGAKRYQRVLGAVVRTLATASAQKLQGAVTATAVRCASLSPLSIMRATAHHATSTVEPISATSCRHRSEEQGSRFAGKSRGRPK